MLEISSLLVGEVARVFLFDLILYVPSTIFQLCRDRSSWVEPVQARINVSCSRTQHRDAVRLEPAALRTLVVVARVIMRSPS